VAVLQVLAHLAEVLFGKGRRPFRQERQAMGNKRAFTRVEVPPSGRIGAGVAMKGGVWYRGQVKDLSLHGMFLALGGDVPVGADVAVTLFLGNNPWGFTLECRGRVVRAADDGIGVEIRHMEKGAFAHYRDLVATVATDPEQVEGELRQYVNPAASD
jgi:hypothetical protein